MHFRELMERLRSDTPSDKSASASNASQTSEIESTGGTLDADEPHRMLCSTLVGKEARALDSTRPLWMSQMRLSLPPLRRTTTSVAGTPMRSRRRLCKFYFPFRAFCTYAVQHDYSLDFQCIHLATFFFTIACFFI